MAKKLFSIAREELEVNKLQRLRDDAEQNGEFDVLYQGIKEDIEAKDTDQSNEEGKEQPLEGEEDVSTDTSDATGIDEVDTEEASVAAESFLRYHQESYTYSVSQEAQFNETYASTFGRYVGNKTLSGLDYLKNIGFEYGPVLIKHVFKGVLYALNKTVRAIVQGSVSMAKYVDKKIHSYENMQADLKKIRDTLELLDDKKIETEFTKEVIINQLKIGNNFNFKESVQIAKTFFEAFFNGFEKNVRGNIAVTRNIVSSVIHEQAVQPTQVIVDRFNFNNFIRRNVDGYIPISDNVDTYAYQYVLPGDLIFIGWLPKHNLTDHESIVNALNSSKMMLGVNTQASAVKDGVKHLTLREIKDMVKTLEAICAYGIELEKSYRSVIKTRNSVRGILNVYMRFLLTSRDKISIRDSLADFIALKVAYMDRTHIAGSMYVNDYMVRIVSASLSYLKEAIKVYS